MDTEVLSADDPRAMERALEVLRLGGLVAFPTDTVYGVGSPAFDGAAVARIYSAKGRMEEKAIPVLLADAAALEAVADRVPEAAARLAGKFWPGALTLVVPRRAELPRQVSATDTVGVRVPDHALARELLARAGPMAVTSANPSGVPSPRTAEEVLAGLGGKIDLLLDGGQTPGAVPSTVVDCTQDPPRLLRAGPIPMEAILAALR